MHRAEDYQGSRSNHHRLWIEKLIKRKEKKKKIFQK